MPRVTIEDLKRIRDANVRTTALRSGEARARVVVHLGTCGIAAGARTVMQALLHEIEARGVNDVLVTTTGCAGLCSREPMVTVELAGRAPVKYVELDPDKMRRIFEEHVLGGSLVPAYALASGSETTG
jgi:NADP-reducing hydrogenase subunit HndB